MVSQTWLLDLLSILPSFPETNLRKKNPDRHHKASSKPWFKQINKKVTDKEVVDENPYLFLPLLSSIPFRIFGIRYGAPS